MNFDSVAELLISLAIVRGAPSGVIYHMRKELDARYHKIEQDKLFAWCMAL